MGCSSNKPRREPAAGPSQRTEALYKAIANYPSRSKEELAFRIGDLLEILSAEPHANWWVARNPATNKEGFIPKNFVAKYDSIQSQP
jgi:SH3 domain